jgi:hypothetical protein
MEEAVAFSQRAATGAGKRRKDKRFEIGSGTGDIIREMGT